MDSRRAGASGARHDGALAASFRALERAVEEGARACARAAETEARRRDAREAERARALEEEVCRWRTMCARARAQVVRCAEALARRASAEATRRALRRWRDATREMREELAKAVVRQGEMKRATFVAWREMARSARSRVARRDDVASLTREAVFYEAKCEDVVAKLAPRVVKKAPKLTDSEAEVRRAFMRGVCALNLEAARVL